MIVLNLQCERGHPFEGWFGSTERFEAQRAAQQVVCPLCDSRRVERSPSAPAIVRGVQSKSSPETRDLQLRETLQKLRALVRSAENVGSRFTDEARRMHEGDAPALDIRGTASLADMQDLVQEGISVLPVPAAWGEEGH